MKELEPSEIHQLRAADGWLGLNSPHDAQGELDKIANQSHLAVMEMQWQVHARKKDWPRAIDAGRAITKEHPDAPFGWVHLAYALHELKMTQEAYDVVAGVLDNFPKEWLMCYNLACYAVQLGRLEEGRTWLKRAAKVGDKKEIEKMMATDPDLERLRKLQKKL